MASLTDDVETTTLPSSEEELSDTDERDIIGEKHKFPRLYETAMELLAIPATSAPLEGIFSQAALVFDCRRYRLSAESSKAELFLRVNDSICWTN